MAPTIVTAFFDIGRTNWTMDHGFPHYVQRSTDVYFERFSYMAEQVCNDMIIYTDENLVERVKDCRKKHKRHTLVLPYNYATEKQELLHKIAAIQQDLAYLCNININQSSNPEYRIPEYVLVNWLKSELVEKSFKDNLVASDAAAWIDFGYCRSRADAGYNNEWNPCKLDKNKINFLQIRDYKLSPMQIKSIIFHNIVYIIGSFMYTKKENWFILANSFRNNYNSLLAENLVDDDQSIMLMCSLSDNSLYSMTQVSEYNQFVCMVDHRIIGDDK